MDDMKQQKKSLKKAYKKAKRKTILPWKTVTIIALVFSLILVPLSVALSMFDNTLAAFVGGSFWELENEDPNANYFELDFSSNGEMYSKGDELCYQVEAEGAALLMNNGALPLEEGSKVSTLSSSSVNLVYGGTGSGNVDASKADNLKVALEKSGFEVNPTLWNWYLSEEGSVYNRGFSAGESAVLAGHASIAEVPVDVYPAEVKDSFAQYGDAVIITFSRVGGEGYDLEFQAYNYLALSEEEQQMLQWASDMKAAGTVKSIIVLINSSNALQVDFLKDDRFDVDACLWIGGVGINGTNAVTDILAGKVNPSGSLVDTYCYDNYSSPAMQNFVATTYEGYSEEIIPSSAKSYMIYQEGIYVGYKYYETRYEDQVMGTGNAGGYDYRADLHTGSSNPSKTIFREVFSTIHKGLESKTFADVIEETGGEKGDANILVSTDPVVIPESDTTEEEKTTESTTRRHTTEASTTKSRNTTEPTTAATTTAPTTTAPTTTAPTTTEPLTQPPTTEPPTSKQEPSSSAENPGE